MLKKVDPTNNVLVSYLQYIDTTVLTWVLHEDEEREKSKKSKKTVGGSLEKVAKVEKKKKISVVEEVSQILTSMVDTPRIEASPSTEMIPSKTGVFRRIKIKRKSQMVKKTQLSHQGVTVREIPAPVSPLSKIQRAEDLAKFLKKSQRLEEVEQVPETPEITLQEEAKTSSPIVTKPLERSSLPQVTSTTDSPTFQLIMDQPFTTIFSTQSTDPPHPSSPTDETMDADAETDDEGFGGTFEALHFDQAEEDFPDHMLMTMKQFKILNSKLHSILQSQADVESGGITSMEVDSLMKVNQNDISTENRINSLRSDFVKDLKDLKLVTKERHVLFIQEVKKVREDVNLQIRELREDMTKEMNPQLTTLSAKEEQNFGELVRLLKELQDLSSKSVSPIVSQEFLSQKFSHFEAILHKNLSPLLRISSLLPNVTEAPPAFTGVQGGEKIDKSKAAEQTKTSEDAKVVGKLYPSKVVTKLSIISAGSVTSTVITTIPLPKPSSKGVVIGKQADVSSSKKLVLSNVEDKGKGILIEKTKEEKKVEVAADVERMRQVISIKRDVIFEGKFENLKYTVARASGKLQEFTVADFPLMNTYYLINIALMLKDKSFSFLQDTEPDVFSLGCKHIKIFLKNYIECLAQTDVELAVVKGIDITAPVSPSKKQNELKNYEDGEICLKPLGIVLAGKDKAGRAKRFLFQTCEVERCTNSQYTNLIVRINHCKKNSEGDKKEIKKVISWYMEI
ncbi:unnamed protein product [Lactuca saligna]|uniref:Uncharacterized protein n=1 Tax=Lactuca saligna TaxID=75948 RepID=A0AA35V759_LACSI|nr:unnamed protein product [Lactuca saligna]